MVIDQTKDCSNPSFVCPGWTGLQFDGECYGTSCFNGGCYGCQDTDHGGRIYADTVGNQYVAPICRYRQNCQRNDYNLANKLDCCLGRSNNGQCAKCWCPGSGSCGNVLLDYCKGKLPDGRSRLLADPDCNNTSSFGQIPRDGVVGGYRTQAITEYCMENGMPKECYCTAPTRAPSDSDVGLDVIANRLGVADDRPVTCWSSECQKSGEYLISQDQICSTTPTPVNICQAMWNLWNAQSTSIQDRVIQKCQFSETNRPPGCQMESDRIKPECRSFFTEVKPKSFWSRYRTLLIIILIVVLTLIITAIIVAAIRKEEKRVAI